MYVNLDARLIYLINQHLLQLHLLVSEYIVSNKIHLKDRQANKSSFNYFFRFRKENYTYCVNTVIILSINNKAIEFIQNEPQSQPQSQ